MLRSLSSSSSFFQSILHVFNTLRFSMHWICVGSFHIRQCTYVYMQVCMHVCLFAARAAAAVRPAAAAAAATAAAVAAVAAVAVAATARATSNRTDRGGETEEHPCNPHTLRKAAQNSSACPSPPLRTANRGAVRRSGAKAGALFFPRGWRRRRRRRKEGMEAGLLPSPFPFFPPRPNERSFLSRAPLPPFPLYPSFFSFRSLRFLLRRQRRKREEKRPEGNGFLWEVKCFQDV